MTQRLDPLRIPRAPRRASGFTLTEVMIALALVAVLLIGISRIFAITSSTISTGQALSRAVRTQRAIGQTLSADMNGYQGAGIEQELTGIIPLAGGSAATELAPFLSISNFRVPTYQSEAAYRAAVVRPADNATTSTIDKRSLLTRELDANGNGIIDNATTSIAQGGEVVSLYEYGLRNFRTDTFSFFSRGHFASQTGANVTGGGAVDYQNGTETNAAWVWYGHLRVFNGNISRLDYADAFGAPGDWYTPQREYVGGSNGSNTPSANLNNRYANQFVLGRMTLLMQDMIDHDGNTSTSKTVVSQNDPSKPVLFVSRNWDTPYDITDGRQATPFNLDASIRKYVRPVTGKTNADVLEHNEVVGINDNIQATGTLLSFRDCRSDVGCASVSLMRARTKAVQECDADPTGPPGPVGIFTGNKAITYTGGTNEWWRYMPIGWYQRFNVNPYPGVAAIGASSKALAQRQQLLSTGVTQFIVEYAGDFVRQNPQTGEIETRLNGQPSNRGDRKDDYTCPDGIIDFVVVNGRRQTRWYGLPRDVDGDGKIAGNTNVGTRPFEPPTALQATPDLNTVAISPPSTPVANLMRTSPDVVPLRDVCGFFHSFEKSAPGGNDDYGTVITEPNSSQNRSLDPTYFSPEYTGYMCLWAPKDVESAVAGLTPGDPSTATPVSVYPVPQMIRVITDVTDDSGKLQEPVRQEQVFYIPQGK